MKIIKNIILGLTLLLSLFGIGYSNNFYYDYNDTNISNTISNNTEIGEIIQTDVIKRNDSSLNKLLDLFNLSQQSRYNTGTSKAIIYTKKIINMLLSFVSLISLVMMIYAFYLMFFSREESGMTRAKQVLKGVAIAIAVMGLSRFIVSFIFWIQTNSGS